MKNLLKVLVIAFTALIFGGVSIAQDKKAEKIEKSAADKPMTEKSTKAKSGTATGEVTSVDAKSGMLTVKTKDKDLNLTAESKSAKNALEKVKPGDTVRVNYSDKEGKMVATSVNADSKGMARSEEKKSSPSTTTEKSSSSTSTERKAEKKQP
jgi:Cu/Ag efflux protein CusF